MLSIGLMSGTSMDGIDASLIETNGDTEVTELGFHSIDYDHEFKLLLKATEQAVRESSGDLDKAPNIKNVIEQSTRLHIKAVQQLLDKTGYIFQDIAAIGYHGQTLYHQPEKKCSVIIGDAKLMANELNIPVVYDFRRQDIEAGGMGAPLAPIYHHALAIRDKVIPIAIVNCGGIANISLVNSEKPEELVGFDTGPGNGLIDHYLRIKTQGKEVMDKDGQYGSRGKVNATVLAALKSNGVHKDAKNYLQQQPPKALDIGDLKLVPDLDTLSIEDACRTLEAFTADCIVNSLDLLNESVAIPQRWVLSGGGWNNPVICNELEQRLKNRLGEQVMIQSADEVGWNSQGLEAQLFAYLAVRKLQNKPTTFPNVTGTSKPTCGGLITVKT